MTDSSMPATLCVDAGTTLIKSVVFAGDGAELVVTKQPTAVTHPRRGYGEQDMAEVWAAVRATITEAVAASPQPIGLVCVTAQGDGAWLVDAAGDPVRPAILWNDARSVQVLDRWRAEGVLERAFRINGSLSNLGLPNAILRTLVADDAAALDSVDAVLTCGSWLYLKLTGVRGLHVSEASAPWLDIVDDRSSPELLELYGLSDYAGLVPPVLDADELAALVLPGVAADLGLPAETPVVLAPYDVVAAAAGGATVLPGAAYCILGTTLCTGSVAEAPDTTGPPSGLTLRTLHGGPVIRAFPTLAGTGVVDWLAELLGLPGGAAVTELAAQADGTGGARVWPYLSEAGERAPFLDEHARGVITGLSFGTGRAELARATVEGLAHVVRDCLHASGVRPVDLALSGGGSASDLWCAVLADVTGVPTVRTVDSQIGAKGAMVYAGVAVGAYPSVVEASEALVRPGTRFEPDPAKRSSFDDAHEEFLGARAAFADRWASWVAR